MDVSLIMKVAGVGILVSFVCQILQKSGREEQATLVSLSGVVIVLLMLLDEISTLLTTIRSVFGI